MSEPTAIEPSTLSSFSLLPLREELHNNFASLGYEFMTPIQAQSLPPMLLGQDVIAQAKTGSGKTAAFGLSLLNSLNEKFFAVQALVLCPTRELAEQTSQSLRQLARLIPNIKIMNLSGGMLLRPQVDSLKHGAHIIVGTPGRVQKHLDKQTLNLQHLKTLVLDEADRMLDMGFFEAIKQVISLCPKKRQSLLFSATYPKEIEQLSKEFMITPQRVIVSAPASEVTIEQYFYELEDKTRKIPLVKALLLHHQPISTLIFCNTKEQTTQLSRFLSQEGFSVLALNGDMEQVDRDEAMIRFTNQSCSILVATDVAARGLDIKELPMVINYDVAFEPEVHIHRIGRTGRAGCGGLAISLTTPTDALRLCAIEEALMTPLNWKTPHELNKQNGSVFLPTMKTLCLSAGKKDKIRPGDLLGCLTKEAGIAGEAIGKITITPMYSYVAIDQQHVLKAYRHLQTGKLKGRTLKVKQLA